jgi:acyl carrier protein
MQAAVTRDYIKEEINKFLSTGFRIPAEKLTEEAHLFNDVGLDSLDAVDMIVNLEDNLNVKIDLERFKNVRTLGDVYNFVTELAKNGSNTH